MAKKPCSIPDCTKPAFCRTWCTTHYSRWQRYADPLHPSRRQSPLTEGATERWCPRCEVSKPVVQFRARPGRNTLKGYCDPCMKAYDAEYSATPAGRARRHAASSKWSKGARVDFDLRKRYGIGEDDYNAMVTAQGGRCAICGTGQASKTAVDRRWHVDHDHATGTIRGLLCNTCNLAIGLMKDDPVRLRAAADYLSRT